MLYCTKIRDERKVDDAMRILVVEDERELREGIVEGLRLDGYAVDSCGDGLEAYELSLVETYDLIILDVNLPNMDGFSLLAELRRENQEVKVLVLSARSSLEDKIKGLDLGANDYLTKPFFFGELEARIRNLLRRQFLQQNRILCCGQVSIDTTTRIATARGEKLALTRKEFALLEYLLHRSGQMIPAEELIEHVWNCEADSLSNSLRVHIASLRKKLRIVLGGDPIHTKMGMGYSIQEECVL